jgi:hypothetical protein
MGRFLPGLGPLLNGAVLLFFGSRPHFERKADTRQAQSSLRRIIWYFNTLFSLNFKSCPQVYACFFGASLTHRTNIALEVGATHI